MKNYEYFTLTVTGSETHTSGYKVQHIHVRDRFSRRRYIIERSVIRSSGNILTRYLHKRPHKRFDSRINIARSFVYLSPAMRALYEYMPGGFVTYHAYDPDKKYVKNGKWLDPLARSFFRHASDGVGVRSRAYAMAWKISTRHKDAASVRWMSIACGVGQATFDAARLLPGDVQFFMIDLDKDALVAARTTAASYHIEEDLLRTEHVNVILEIDRLTRYVKQYQPSVVDIMGLFEYLPKKDAALLLGTIYRSLPVGSTVVFTNMMPSHPHLAVHRHGMGWPGVIVREQEEVVAICELAKVPLERLAIILPDDNVYAVYEVQT